MSIRTDHVVAIRITMRIVMLGPFSLQPPATKVSIISVISAIGTKSLEPKTSFITVVLPSRHVTGYYVARLSQCREGLSYVDC